MTAKPSGFRGCCVVALGPARRAAAIRGRARARWRSPGFIDTLRADRLPVYGYAPGRTPALDGVREGSGRLRPRLQPRAPDAAVACLDVHRPPAIRARGARQSRVHAARRARRRWPRVRAPAIRPPASCPRTCCAPTPASLRGSTHSTRRFPRGRRPIARTGPAAGPETLAAADAWLRSQTRTDSSSSSTSTSRTSLPAAGPFPGLDAYDGEVAFSDEIVGPLFEAQARGGTTTRRSSCCPITARDSAITSRRSTASSSTKKWSACRG